MKKCALLISGLLLILISPLSAQTISPTIKSMVKEGGNVTEFWITLTDEKNNSLIVVINDMGEIISFIGESPSFKYDNYPDNVYRIRKCNNIEFDYYQNDQSTDLSNKPSQIGEWKIDYYRVWTDNYRYGKISRLGNLTFDYYKSFTDDGKSGKLSQIGNIKLDYFTDSPAFRGRVTSIGNYKINYCNTSQGVNNFGKICSVEGEDKSVDIFVVF